MTSGVGTPVTLADVATEVRSKNAGPFWLTLDVFFDSDESYQRVVDARAVNADAVAALYRVPTETISIFEMPSVRALKVSFPRPVVAGSFYDRDLHAGQQHVLLAGLSV